MIYITVMQEKAIAKKQGTMLRGLDSREVERSRREFGRNVMSSVKKKSFVRRFFENLGDPVVRILMCALLINVIFMFKSRLNN